MLKWDGKHNLNLIARAANAPIQRSLGKKKKKRAEPKQTNKYAWKKQEW